MADTTNITIPIEAAKALQSALNQADEGQDINIKIIRHNGSRHDLLIKDSKPICALKMWCVGKFGIPENHLALFKESDLTFIGSGADWEMRPLSAFGIGEGARVSAVDLVLAVADG